jgi:hypothetical protein
MSPVAQRTLQAPPRHAADPVEGTGQTLQVGPQARTSSSRAHSPEQKWVFGKQLNPQTPV